MKYFINWLRFLVTEPDVASVRMMSTWLLSDLQTELYFSMQAKKSAICNGKFRNLQGFKILKSPYLPKNAFLK